MNFSQIGLNQIVSFMYHIFLARKYRSSYSLQAEAQPRGDAHWAFAPPVSFEDALEANAAPAHEKDLQAPKAPANPFRM